MAYSVMLTQTFARVDYPPDGGCEFTFCIVNSAFSSIFLGVLLDEVGKWCIMALRKTKTSP